MCNIDQVITTETQVGGVEHWMCKGARRRGGGCGAQEWTWGKAGKAGGRLGFQQPAKAVELQGRPGVARRLPGEARGQAGAQPQGRHQLLPPSPGEDEQGVARGPHAHGLLEGGGAGGHHLPPGHHACRPAGLAALPRPGARVHDVSRPRAGAVDPAHRHGGGGGTLFLRQAMGQLLLVAWPVQQPRPPATKDRVREVLTAASMWTLPAESVSSTALRPSTTQGNTAVCHARAQFQATLFLSGSGAPGVPGGPGGPGGPDALANDNLLFWERTSFAREFRAHRRIHSCQQLAIRITGVQQMNPWKMVSWDSGEPAEASPDMWLWSGAQVFGIHGCLAWTLQPSANSVCTLAKLRPEQPCCFFAHPQLNFLWVFDQCVAHISPCTAGLKHAGCTFHYTHASCCCLQLQGAAAPSRSSGRFPAAALAARRPARTWSSFNRGASPSTGTGGRRANTSENLGGRFFSEVRIALGLPRRRKRLPSISRFFLHGHFAIWLREFSGAACPSWQA